MAKLGQTRWSAKSLFTGSNPVVCSILNMKYIHADMLLYYSLLGRSQVSSERLEHIRKRLVEEVEEVLSPVTLREIQSEVALQPLVLKLKQYDNGFIVKKVEGSFSCVFDEKFLDRCFASFYSEEEFAKIKRIFATS